ncbi:hypothetical protein BB561_005841 [Smittium simulii]|uniref:Uncharacterized protein n=1 Tax=Smittium simulii TaxID=133385 RepID=A0A2T9Y826_9FUNG|nr:hypothetical protein BB561_005841 [Smittium simulii]
MSFNSNTSETSKFKKADSANSSCGNSPPSFFINPDNNPLYNSLYQHKTQSSSYVNNLSKNDSMLLLSDQRDLNTSPSNSAFSQTSTRKHSLIPLSKRNPSYDGSYSENSSTDIDYLEITSKNLDKSPLFVSKLVKPTYDLPLKGSASKHHFRSKSICRIPNSKKPVSLLNRFLSKYLPDSNHPLSKAMSAVSAMNRRVWAAGITIFKPLKTHLSDKIVNFTAFKRQKALQFEIEADIASYPLLARQLFYLSTFVNLHDLFFALLNRYIEEDLNFGYSYIIYGLSFIMTSFFIEIFTHKNGFTLRSNKTIRFASLAPWAAWAVLNTIIEHIALSNNSSITAFQYFKVASLITVCIFSYVYTKKKLGPSAFLSILLVFTGGFFASMFTPLIQFDIPYFSLNSFVFSILYCISFPAFLVSFKSYVDSTRADLLLFLRFYAPVVALFTMIPVFSSTDISSFLDFKLNTISALLILDWDPLPPLL